MIWPGITEPHIILRCAGAFLLPQITSPDVGSTLACRTFRTSEVSTDIASSRAKCAEERKHDKSDAICAAMGSHFSPFALETTGGPGGLYRDGVLALRQAPARLGGSAGGRARGQKLNQDISFALRRGTIAQVTDYTCP